MDCVLPEVLAGVAKLQEHRVCDGLTRQRSACSPEGHGHAMLPGNGQDLLDLLLAVHLLTTNFFNMTLKAVSWCMLRHKKRALLIRRATTP